MRVPQRGQKRIRGRRIGPAKPRGLERPDASARHATPARRHATRELAGSSVLVVVLVFLLVQLLAQAAHFLAQPLHLLVAASAVALIPVDARAIPIANDDASIARSVRAERRRAASVV